MLRCLYDVRLHADDEYDIEETERPLTIASHRVITLRAWERRERRGVATTRTDATAATAAGKRPETLNPGKNRVLEKARFGTFVESGEISLFYIARLCHVTYLYFCIQIFESLKYTEHATSLVYLVTLPGRFVVVGHCAMLRQPHLSHFVQSWVWILFLELRR